MTQVKLNIEINNVAKDLIEESFLKSVAQKTLAFCFSKRGYLGKKNVSVSLALVSSREIKKLNRIYRKKNSATDVLSFPEYKNQKELTASGDKEMFLGEIILCYNYIKEYAGKNQEDEKTELAKAVSHGLLHLLGFCHGKEMFRIQNSAVKNIK